jgi:hypothetical protein
LYSKIGYILHITQSRLFNQEDNRSWIGNTHARSDQKAKERTSLPDTTSNSRIILKMRKAKIQRLLWGVMDNNRIRNANE